MFITGRKTNKTQKCPCQYLNLGTISSRGEYKLFIDVLFINTQVIEWISGILRF